MKRFLFHILFLSLLAYGFFLSSSYAVKSARQSAEESPQYALVEGNVENPGYYKVDSFSTNLDLLQKAGLTDSSQINNINLNEAAVPNQSLQVAVSETKVKPKQISTFTEPRLEFILGEVVYKRQEEVKKAQNRVSLAEGDLIFFRKTGQGKISFKNLSEIDASQDTKLSIQKIDQENSPTLTVMLLEQGKIRIRIPSETPGSALVLVTPDYRLDFSEGITDVIVHIKQFDTQIHTGKGLVKLTRLTDQVSVQIGANQIVSAKMGDATMEPVARPFTKQTLESSFGKLEKEFQDFKKNQQELSILMTSGSFNLLVSLIPEKNKLILMDIPSNTYVGDYIDGVFRLDHTLGIAGSEITREVLQRVLGRQIRFVARIDFKNIYNFAYTLDNLGVEVDQSAALSMGIPPGFRILKENEILKFLNPRMAGGEKMAMVRQKRVIKAFMNKMSEGGVATYSHVVMSLLKEIEGNMNIEDGLSVFKVYSQRERWSISEASMPGVTYPVGPIVLIKPDYDAIQRLF